MAHRRARILRLSAQGAMVPSHCGRFGSGCGMMTKHLNRDRLETIRPKARSGERKPIFTQETAGAIIRLMHQSPEAYGLNTACWTTYHMAEVLVQMGHVERISYQSVQRLLTGAGYTWRRAKRWLETSDPPYLAKKAARWHRQRFCCPCAALGRWRWNPSSVKASAVCCTNANSWTFLR